MNYKRNKIAGKERPYTFYEFKEIIEELCKQKKVPCIDALDYFNAEGSWFDFAEQLFVDDNDVDIVSQTSFGACEGVYSSFYFIKGGERIYFAVAKNLSDTDDAFLNMSIFAAKFCLLAKKYLSEHDEEFRWSGYDVGYEDANGKFVALVNCGTLEGAEAYARKLQGEGKKAIIIDNSTKKKTVIS